MTKTEVRAAKKLLEKAAVELARLRGQVRETGLAIGDGEVPVLERLVDSVAIEAASVADAFDALCSSSWSSRGISKHEKVRRALGYYPAPPRRSRRSRFA